MDSLAEIAEDEVRSISNSDLRQDERVVPKLAVRDQQAVVLCGRFGL